MRYLLIIAIFLSLPAFAQEAKQVMSARYRLARGDYQEAIKPNQLLLSGRNYFKEYPKTGGHQFFDSKTYTVNPIQYDGVTYETVAMNYDVFNQELITITYQDGQVIYMLIDISRVDEFHLNDARFIQLKEGDYEGIEPGIYQEAFADKGVNLFVKRTKERSKIAQADYLKYRYRFSSKDQFFLTGPWGVQEVKSKKDLLDVLPDEAGAIIEQRDLRLKENLDSYLEEMVELLEAISG